MPLPGLRALKNASGLSWGQLALLCGLNSRAISSYANGVNNAGTEAAERIARALGTTVEALRELPAEGPALDTVEATPADRRRAAVEAAKKRPRVGVCGHKLAADNDNAYCSPCAKEWFDENLGGTLPGWPRVTTQGRHRRDAVYVALPGLDAARKAAGLTKLELARRVGSSDRTVGKWCAGETRVPEGALPSVVEALGCSLNDLKWGEKS